MKRSLIFLVSFLLVIPILDAVGFKDIPDLNLTTGQNSRVVDLDSYFNGSSTEWKYEFKNGDKGLRGVTVTIGSRGSVNINVLDPGEYSIIFLAENDTDTLESNDVDLTVTGESIQNTTYDFFPVSTNLTTNVGDTETFAVSGDNVTAEWFLDGLKLPITGGTFDYDALTEGTYEIKVTVDGQSNIWTLVVDPEEVEEEVPIVPVESISECGNGERETGENCENCPEDVGCVEGTICKNAVCVKDKSFDMAIIWFSILGVVIVGLVVGIIFAKKKGYLDYLNLGFIKNIFSKKKKEGVKEEKLLEKASAKEEPEKDLNPLKDYLIGNLKKGFKKEDLVQTALRQGWKQEEINKVLEVDERLKPLYNYISNNLKRGFGKDELIRAALAQGWKQDEINEVLGKL